MDNTSASPFTDEIKAQLKEMEIDAQVMEDGRKLFYALEELARQVAKQLSDNEIVAGQLTNFIFPMLVFGSESLFKDHFSPEVLQEVRVIFMTERNGASALIGASTLMQTLAEKTDEPK